MWTRYGLAVGATLMAGPPDSTHQIASRPVLNDRQRAYLLAICRLCYEWAAHFARLSGGRPVLFGLEQMP